MKISALNSAGYIKNNKLNQIQSKKEVIFNNQSDKVSLPLSNYGKAQIGLHKKYSPSFGFDPATIALILIYAGVLGAGVYKTNLDDKKREEEEKRIQQERENSINGISKKLNVSYEEAKDYHYSFMRLAAIPPSNDGNEKGLNSVQGYGIEKYRLSMEVIAPIVAKSEEKYLGYDGTVPNGVLLFGPTGGGKTYMSDKVGEHLRYLGLPVEDVELSESNHSQNVRTIKESFKKAEDRYKETGVLTLINFKQDIDNFLLDRRTHPDCIKEVRTALKCMENCAQRGAVWIGTSNNPQMLDSAILRPGRTDVKIPVGDMEDFAVADMLKYSLYKYDEKESAEDFEYEKVLESMKENMQVYTPAELELFVNQAKNHKLSHNQLITADMVIAEMNRYSQNDFPTLNEKTKQRFKEDKDYIENLEYKDNDKNVKQN